MLLTVKEIDALKPDPTRNQRLSDGENLYLLVQKNGSRLWRWDYAFQGRRNTMSFGAYPLITLQRAREKKRDAKLLLDRGIDPGAKRQEEKASYQGENKGETLKQVAALWIAQKEAEGNSPATIEKYHSVLNNHVYPELEQRPIKDLKAPDLAKVAKAVDLSNKLEAAHKVVEFLQGIFAYAFNNGLVEKNEAAYLYEVIRAKKPKHYPGITEEREVGRLMRSIVTNTGGDFSVRMLLKLMPYVFLRPGEVGGLKKTEVHLDRKVLEIPAERMSHRFSNGKFHVVPLSRQALAILKDMMALPNGSPYVFPGRERGRPVSDGTIQGMLRRLGYSPEEHVPHGFRTTASTRLREEPLNWDDRPIELQLAHQFGNPVMSAYDKSAIIEKRTKMMQQWADYLDQLRKQADQKDADRRG